MADIAIEEIATDHLPEPLRGVLQVLPLPLLIRLSRQVSLAAGTVQEDGGLEGRVVMTVKAATNKETGDVEVGYRLKTILGDEESTAIGAMKDGQLTLPGTELAGYTPIPNLRRAFSTLGTREND